MSDGDTTTSTFKMETSGKRPSSPTRDCLNQQSCSLASATPPPPFNGSWMTLSGIWLLKDGLSSTWMIYSFPPPIPTSTLNTPSESSSKWRLKHIEMDPTKLNRIRNWPTLAKVKDVPSFLRFTNFYRKFIGDYSNITCPLLDLTKKDTLWNWNNSCQNAFNRLKNCFLTKPILHLPDISKPFTITTDACKYASGGVLLQTDSNGKWHPCSYLSQSFGLAKWNYNIYNRELLAIIHGLKTWCHYLQGSSSPVQVFTDHKNLTFLKQAQKLNRRQAQWMLDLANYDLKVIHLPGSKLCTPNALSRWPDLIPKIDNDDRGVTLLPPSLFINLIDIELNKKNHKILRQRPLGTQCTPSPQMGSPHPIQIQVIQLVLWCRHPCLPGMSIPSW